MGSHFSLPCCSKEGVANRIETFHEPQWALNSACACDGASIRFEEEEEEEEEEKEEEEEEEEEE